jgi:NAD(P)-dependent dehydrogenase (short-subunit alcohol dehydrogenase family)
MSHHFQASGIRPDNSPSKNSPEGGRYALLDINLTHPTRVTQFAISHFLAADPASKSPKTVIEVSSIAGQTSPLAAPIYNATKHAINGSVRGLAPLEAKLGIRVAGCGAWSGQDTAVDQARGEYEGRQWRRCVGNP